MADWLALTAGVAEPDLAALQQQAPLLVAKAAEEERLNWSGFLQDSRQWLLPSNHKCFIEYFMKFFEWCVGILNCQIFP